MKQLKVIVQDKTTLVLQEDGQKGDIISLTDLEELDTSAIEKAIQENTDRVYARKLQEYKATLDATHAKEKTEWESKQQLEVSDLKHKYNSTIEDLKHQIAILNGNMDTKVKEAKNSAALEMEKLAREKDSQYQDLKAKYDTLQANLDEKLKSKELEVTNIFKDKLNQLENEKTILEQTSSQQLESQKAKMELEKEKSIMELQTKFNEELNSKTTELTNKQNEIDDLKRQRSIASVKVIGEELETWCNREVSSYMQNGFTNCTWEKDNKVVKEEGENKGSKADYLFKVYADEAKELELTSVCMDMKSEDPNSVNKKTNADYYNQLDKNRTKKNCKYALLVSELEMNKVNDLPIFKVMEYPNMYVVRPQYLMTFLNMITSLTTRFKDLVLAKQKEDLNFKEKEELLSEFEDIKNTYLDKPLIGLKNQLDNINDANETILKAHNKIQDTVTKITTSYIGQINDKIAKFEIKLDREYRKIEKLS